MRKNHFQEELPQLARDVSQELRGRTESSIVVAEPHSKRLYTFETRSLLYMEALAKDCRFVTAAGGTILTARLMELEERLRPHGFVRCHRSYLVNCQYIFSLDDRTVLPVYRRILSPSRGRAEELRESFFAYVNGGSA